MSRYLEICRTCNQLRNSKLVVDYLNNKINGTTSYDLNFETIKRHSDLIDKNDSEYACGLFLDMHEYMIDVAAFCKREVPEGC